ncbi:MAG: septum formation protein Maf [Proteiniphilum sp.]|nr:septum formation protein Maf [Proteiniphilum sp.]
MKFDNYNIILASNSPRRRELLSGLDVDYEVRILDNIDESYPNDIPLEDVAEYLAIKKANSYANGLLDNEILITADTIVLIDNEIYGKPKDKADALRMLNGMSNKTHRVITGVCLVSTQKSVSFSSTTSVTFGSLDEGEINYYIDKYKPYDKAGSYGVQEWIGYVGVKHIEGSYYNVMGLPIYRVYEELKKFVEQ